MGYHQETAERLRHVLSGRQDVAEKRMVGGLSFLVNGSMCCGVTSTALMVRVGPEACDEALSRPHARPMEFAGRRLSGYVCVEPEGYQTDAELSRRPFALKPASPAPLPRWARRRAER